MKQAFKVFSAARQLILITTHLPATRPAKPIATALLVLAVVSCCLFSCTKTGLKPSNDPLALSSGGNGGGGNGGGGNGGGGNGGGKGGGGSQPTTPPAPAPTTTPTSLSISEVVTTGTWNVYSYTEKTENSTQKFSGFTFTFNADRTLTAQEGSKVTTGTWRPAEAIFYYGIPVYGSSPDGFFITLSSNLPLSLLGKNFFVSFKGLTTFTLESINPAEDTHVTFTK